MKSNLNFTIDKNEILNSDLTINESGILNRNNKRNFTRKYKNVRFC